MKKTLNLQEFRKVCRVGMKFKFSEFSDEHTIVYSNEYEYVYITPDGDDITRSFFITSRPHNQITITHTPKITWDNLREGDGLSTEHNEKVTILARLNDCVLLSANFHKDYVSRWDTTANLKRQSYTIIQPDTVEEKPKSDCCGVVERGIKLSHAEKLLSEYEGVKVTIIPD